MSVTNTDVRGAMEPCGQEHHVDCGLLDVLARLGERWTVLVLAQLSAGTHRFAQIEKSIFGISQRMLTLTLRRLERDGMISRQVVASVPAQVSYSLTDRGAELTALIQGLADWSLANRELIAQSQQAFDATKESRARP